MHEHMIRDTDKYFIIDGITRTIKNSSDNKKLLVAGDFNSERFSFQLPRYIDGHDMSLCDSVQIHYINTSSGTRDTILGIYEVDDLRINPDDESTVILSWLISSKVTKLSGVLSFALRFVCTEDGDVVYAWNTAICSGITISPTIYNTDEVVDESYIDILEQWRNKLISAVPIVKVQKLEENRGVKVSIENPNGITESEILNGTTPHIGQNGNWYIGENDTGKTSQGLPGKDGSPGQKGYSPEITLTEISEGIQIEVQNEDDTQSYIVHHGKNGQNGQNATDDMVRDAVNTYMEENPIEDIPIICEVSGKSPLIIQDSADKKVQNITIQGWTKQNTTTGANLFDVQSDTALFQHPDTFIKSEGNKIVVKAWAMLFIKGDKAKELFPLNSVRTFKFKVVKKENAIGATLFSDRLGFLLYNKTKGVTIDSYLVNNLNETGKEAEFSKTFTISETAYEDSDEINLYVYTERYLDDNEVEDFSVCEFYDIMISESDVPYEPYTGGKPSPSLDYPQEIVSAGRWNEDTQKWEYDVKLRTENLYYDGDKENIDLYQTDFIEWTGNDRLFFNFDAETDTPDGKCYINCLYYDSQRNRLGTNGYATVVGTNRTHVKANFIGASAGADEDGTRYDIDLKEVKYIKLNFEIYSDSAKKISYYNIVLSDDDNVEFSGYHRPQKITLTSDHPLTKWDRLEKRDGVWGWVYKSLERKLSEFNVMVSNSENPNGKTFRFDIPEINTDGFITHYKRSVYNYTNQLLDGEFLSIKGIIYICDASFDTSEIFQQYLMENNVLVVFETTDKTFVPLSESEQQALNALHTYCPATVITNEQGCEMSIEYVADTKTYIDTQIEKAVTRAIILSKGQ